MWSADSDHAVNPPSTARFWFIPLWIAQSQQKAHAISKDSDQTWQMHRLIWVILKFHCVLAHMFLCRNKKNIMWLVLESPNYLEPSIASSSTKGKYVTAYRFIIILQFVQVNQVTIIVFTLNHTCSSRLGTFVNQKKISMFSHFSTKTYVVVLIRSVLPVTLSF